MLFYGPIKKDQKEHIYRLTKKKKKKKFDHTYTHIYFKLYLWKPFHKIISNESKMFSHFKQVPFGYLSKLNYVKVDLGSCLVLNMHLKKLFCLRLFYFIFVTFTIILRSIH